MKILKIIIFILLSSYSNSIAQELTGQKADEYFKGASYVKLDEQRKTVSFVRLKEPVPIASSQVATWLNLNVLDGRPEEEMVLLRSDRDKVGYTHLRFKQFYRSLPVEYSMFIVHMQAEKLVSANGELYSGIDIGTQASIDIQAAISAARNHLPAETFITSTEDPNPELLILPTSAGNYLLTYKVDVNSEKPLARNWVYVDAVTGKIVHVINRLETFDVPATAHTRYSGVRTIMTDSLSPTNFVLKETNRGAGATIDTKNLQNGSSYASAVNFTNTSTVWPLIYDNAALDAHFGAEKTYDFYYNLYGYHSYDNAGAAINSFVHYNTNYVNAFWNGSVMTYGDGDGFQYSPLTSMEIVGHEITHAVTENSAALVYSGESGALNESFSDIMGNSIRFLNDPSNATWLVGDQIVIPGGGATPFRNMANPNEYECADTYGGLYFNNGDVVHYDSGIQNYWFYLLSMGGSGTNDLGNNFIVNGIGLADANAIAFRNLTVYLTPNSNFAAARTGAISAAIDLFGSCSPQVAQTTNAWHAVGVGGPFVNSIIAGFSSDQNYTCSIPSTVNFTNSSNNATSYLWDFGDGSTSTLANPTHVYTQLGVYDVTLIALGTALCNTSDTLLQTNFITVTNNPGPTTATCLPATQTYCCNVGILNVNFGGINKTSGNSQEGYKDYTCNNVANLIAGNTYPFSVSVSASSLENLKAWIDYNNDGSFNNVSELLYSTTGFSGQKTGFVNTSTTAVLGVPLRMRIIDDRSINTISNACNNPINGQAEDYTVIFSANTLPPIADFTANVTSVSVGNAVTFSDLTQNAPTGWTWSFPGGTPASSSNQNPVITYNAIGVYPVTLHVQNAFGIDSIIKVGYISVVNQVNMCSTTLSVAPNGILFDSGGPTGDYQDSENCSLTITPACATSISLSFVSFSTESGFDDIYVYDGVNATAPLLYTGTGSTLPPTLNATSGKMHIVFQTDGSVVYPGFEAHWTSVIASSIAPVALFSMADTNPPINTPVQFNDTSLNIPNAWLWDFGDGGFSTLQNPTHAFTSSGLFKVKLIAFTCNNTDTIIKDVHVQSAPIVSTSPDTLFAALSCGDSTMVQLTVYNTGAGDLVYSNQNYLSTDTVRVLAYTYGSDLTREYLNTIQSISTYFNRYTLTTFDGTTSTGLTNALVDKDVILFIEQESGGTTHYSSFAPILQAFLQGGGSVVTCGSSSTYNARIVSMGLFQGVTGTVYTNQTLTTVDTTHFITDNVPLSFTAADATISVNFTDLDKVNLVKSSTTSNEIVNYRNVGNGVVSYVGFDFYNFNPTTSRLIANAVAGAGQGQGFPWISTTTQSDTVSPGDSSIIQFMISTEMLNAGITNGFVLLYTNDPLNPTLQIPVVLTVLGSPAIALSDSCIHYNDQLENAISLDSIMVENQGCDTLFISNITTASSEFVPDTIGPIAIPPFSSYHLVVSFSSGNSGTYATTLFIQNNDQDTSICLTGSVLDAPIIDLTPDSFHVTLFSGDSITLPLVIRNLGLGVLNDTIISGPNFVNNNVAILVIRDGTAWGLNVENYINTNFGIIPDVITSSQIAATNFHNYDYIITTGNQSNAYYTTLTSHKLKFEDFAFNGGILQHQCAMMTGALVELAGGTEVDFQLSTNNLGLIMTHPILANVVNPIVGNSASHGVISNYPAGATVLTQTSGTLLPTTVLYNYGAGKVLVTSMTWEFAIMNNLNFGQMLPNSINFMKDYSGNWLIVQDTNHIINGLDSTIHDVKFNATGLVSGNYYSSFSVISNDPVNPSIVVPCTLTVVGIPDILLSKTMLDYDTVFVGSVSTDSLWVSNEGTDTLFVSSLVSSNPYFVANQNSFSLPPGDSILVKVDFQPLSVGTYLDSITIFNNDQDTVIYVMGVAVDAPILNYFPSTINVQLSNCPDSLVVPITVYNTGGSDLTFTINELGNSVSNINVLALTYGVDMNEEYLNTIAAINQYFTNYTLTTTSTTTSTGLQSELVGKDVFLMPEPENGSTTVFLNYSVPLQNFVNNGGTVIFCGASSTYTTCILNTGLLSGNYAGNAWNSNVSVINTSTSLTDSIPLSYLASNATYTMNITNPDKTELISHNNNDVVTYRTIGAGKVIFIANDFFAYSANEARLISNAIKWGVQGEIPWVELDTLSGVLVPGDSSIIYVTINGTDLSPGNHQSYIIIESNDPQHPIDTIPINLTIDAVPCTDFIFTSDSCGHSADFTSLTYLPNATYSWNFGDGITSTLNDPTHIYQLPGTYTVQLIVCNLGICDTSFSTFQTGAIFNAPALGCAPVTQSYCCGHGIYNVSLGNINRSSGDGMEGFQDYACTDTTTLVAGYTYTISVTTDSLVQENVKAWIDYNNDGFFLTNEIIFTSNAGTSVHSGNVLIPNAGVYNTPLRMRVGADNASAPSLLPCQAPLNGQFEDYTVFIKNNVSLLENNSLLNLSLQPNPFRDHTELSFVWQTNGSIRIEVLNLLGQNIENVFESDNLSAGNYSFTIRLNESGIYFVKISTDDSYLLKKIVKTE